MKQIKLYLDPPDSKAKCPYGVNIDENRPDTYLCVVRSSESGGVMLNCDESKCPFGDE